VVEALNEEARWPAGGFDFYFNSALTEVAKLEPLWDIEAPV
jgi:hypothetical protein